MLTGAILAVAIGGETHAVAFLQTNLVTNIQTTNALTDPSLVNAWGVSQSGTSPVWVWDNGTGVSTLYTVKPTTNAITKNGLTVSILGSGSVTGQVFNSSAGTGAFNGDAFLFVPRRHGRRSQGFGRRTQPGGDVHRSHCQRATRPSTSRSWGPRSTSPTRCRMRPSMTRWAASDSAWSTSLT
jgi:hypothetical protein